MIRPYDVQAFFRLQRARFERGPTKLSAFTCRGEDMDVDAENDNDNERANDNDKWNVCETSLLVAKSTTSWYRVSLKDVLLRYGLERWMRVPFEKIAPRVLAVVKASDADLFEALQAHVPSLRDMSQTVQQMDEEGKESVILVKCSTNEHVLNYYMHYDVREFEAWSKALKLPMDPANDDPKAKLTLEMFIGDAVVDMKRGKWSKPKDLRLPMEHALCVNNAAFAGRAVDLAQRFEPKALCTREAFVKLFGEVQALQVDLHSEGGWAAAAQLLEWRPVELQTQEEWDKMDAKF